jgi:hypothetical protein
MKNLFLLLAQLAEKDGVSGVLSHRPGLWERKIDDQWTIAVNAHKEPVESLTTDGMNCKVPPFHCAVWFNGRLAGMYSAYDAWMADGAAANLKAFRLALKRAIGVTRLKPSADM